MDDLLTEFLTETSESLGTLEGQLAKFEQDPKRLVHTIKDTLGFLGLPRLEEIDMATAEHSHGQYVVQYRGHLMPLIPFNPDHQWKTEGRQPILVFTDRDRSMGLVLDDIDDIVEDHLDIESSVD